VSISEKVWRTAVLPSKVSIKQAIATLNETGLQIVLVVDRQGILLGTVTDGDIRRGLLRGLGLEDPLEGVMRRNSLVVPPEMSRDVVLQLMHANRFRQLPVVDADHRIVGLHLWDEISTPAERPNLMVIMAGGLGTRLRPHTEQCPKPMLPVAGKPMLEHIIERAKGEGFIRFVISIQYLGHIIEDYFGNGECLGVRIDYLKESTPLGTAGALSMLSPVPEIPFVVTNGDVLSDIKYGELLDFHARHSAVATMAVRLHEWQHPFGVVQTQGVDIVGFEEKPVVRSNINAGVYALSHEALNFLERDEPCDMPTLFEKAQANGKRVVAYPMHEPWLDVGRPDDLILANRNVVP
jgi:dTDP-glucose pyrophosphorylase